MIVIVSTTLIYADIKQVFRGAIDTQLADYCNKRTDGQTNGHTDERDGQSYKCMTLLNTCIQCSKTCLKLFVWY